MPNGFESLGNNNSEFVNNEFTISTEPAALAAQERPAEEIVTEAISIEQPDTSEGITDGSEILAKIDGVVMETRGGGSDSSENSGDTERNVEDGLRIQKIGQVAETQNRLALVRETLDRVKRTAGDVLGSIREFAEKAAMACKNHIRESVALISVAAILTACGVTGDKLATAPNGSDARTEITALAGEQANGVTYDYSHYADREGKESANAYDYSLANCYGDREATAQGIMDVAKRTPEALASYAFTILTPEEKAELGIDGKSMVEIDDMMSNDPNGGVLQRQIIDKLDGALSDPSTVFSFYKENDFETSSYVYFVDSNEDGVYSPDELHIGYANVQRNGSPQVDIKRPVNSKRPLASGTSSKGEWETASYQVTDINLSCGGQVNYGVGEFPPGVPYVDPNDENPDPQKPTEPSTQPATEWGKSGDPHGGDLVEKSDKVDPNSEVSKEQNDNTNKGNQGYVDDNHATPGSGSENNGVGNNGYTSSDIVAPGASTEGERLSGGESQGGSGTNGENVYHSPESISEGQQVDNSGNAAQEAAQASGGENGGGASAGEDNYSDTGEEAAVENGDF